MTDNTVTMVTVSCDECDWQKTAPEKGSGNANWLLATHKARAKGHARYEQKRGERTDDAAKGNGSKPPEGAGEPLPTGGATPGAESEQASPIPPRRPLRGRARTMWGGGAKKDEPGEGSTADRSGPPASRSAETPPARPRPRRVDTVDFWERAWAWGGRQVERLDLPVGRALQIESPAAGPILEDALRDTALDRPIQWLVRHESAYEKVAALLAIPVMVGMIERGGAATFEAMAPYLQDALVTIGPEMAKSIARREKKQADFEKTMAGLGPALGKQPGEPVTMIDVLQWLFPPNPEQAAQAQARAQAGVPVT